MRNAARLACAIALIFAHRAEAADWLSIQGTEVDRPEVAFQPFGFVEPAYEQIFGSPVNGLTAPALEPFNGRRAAFNLVGEDSTDSFAVRRARLGARGTVPNTDRRVNWLVSIDSGTSALTRAAPVAAVDASATFSYVPGLRLRFGRFKLPLMDDALEGNPYASEFIAYTLAASQLLLENRVRTGSFVGNQNGFRDLGLEAFDAFQQGHGAVSYALMLSNGTPGGLDFDQGKDVTARVMLSWIFDENASRADKHRPEVSVFAWRQQGSRRLETGTVDRIRQGLGLHFEKGRWRARAELVDARGALETGPFPPFAGQPQQVLPDGHAVAWYVMGRVTTGLFRWAARYDELRRDIENAAAERIFRVVTLGGEVHVLDAVRVQVNYEFRRLSAPNGTADAKTIAATMGDRVLLQGVVTF